MREHFSLSVSLDLSIYLSMYMSIRLSHSEHKRTHTNTHCIYTHSLSLTLSLLSLSLYLSLSLSLSLQSPLLTKRQVCTEDKGPVLRGGAGRGADTAAVDVVRHAQPPRLVAHHRRHRRVLSSDSDATSATERLGERGTVPLKTRKNKRNGFPRTSGMAATKRWGVMREMGRVMAAMKASP